MSSTRASLLALVVCIACVIALAWAWRERTLAPRPRTSDYNDSDFEPLDDLRQRRFDEWLRGAGREESP